MALTDDKRALRERAAVARDTLDESVRETAGVALCWRVLSDVPIADEAVVSAFWPAKGEIDTRPVLRALHRRGHPCVLPIVHGKGMPLSFRRWTPETVLVQASFGISVPPPEADELNPDMLLVPLLAFDRFGWRLGWGGGFYDRTLEQSRASRKVIAVGAAFSVQEVDSVPHGPHDQPLDWIVTDRETIRCGAAA